MVVVNMDDKSKGSLQIDNYPLLLINDALTRETAMYYVNDDDQVDSIWDTSNEARKTALSFRRPLVTNALSGLALLDMLLSITSPPGIPDGPEWLMDVSEICQVLIWLVFVAVCLIRLKYMWKARSKWYSGAMEPPWGIVQAIVILVLMPVHIISYYSAGMTKYTRFDSVIVHCPNSLSMFLQGWCKAWVYVYFNKGIRDAFMTLMKVFTCLMPLALLLLVSFFAHFFIFQGLTVGAGVTGSGFGPGQNVSDALYELFGLMTTVNHPDVMMWLVNAKPLSFLFIISFMFFTNIIGLNLLLAIVYGEYVGSLAVELERKAMLRSKMLGTAFDMITEPLGRNYLTPAELTDVLRQCIGEAPPAFPDDTDRVTKVVRLIDNKALAVEDNDHPDDNAQDHQIEKEDMKELIVFWNVPMHMKSANKPSTRRELAIAEKEAVAADSDAGMAERIKAEVEHMKKITIGEWCATYPSWYRTMNLNGAGAEDSDSLFATFNPWYERSYIVQFHNVWFFFYVIYCIFTTSNVSVDSASGVLLMLSAVIQLLFVIVSIVADMRPWQAMHFFNPNNKMLLMNVTNFGLLVFLWIEFLAISISQSAFGEWNKPDSNKLIIVSAAAGKFFQVCTFAVETPSVRLLLVAIMRTLPNLGTHLGLFLAVYWGFAGMGVSFYCGLLLQSNSDGGPGKWGQAGAVTGTSPAFGTPWDSTPYGGNPYYYNLNYDGFPQAVASLYVVMIQNNWNVAADGPIEVTNGNHRWFFFTFTVIVAFVMMNVLVGAIIDALNAVREEMLAEKAGEKDELEVVCQKRIDATAAPSGNYYGETWELGDVELYGEVRFDAELCSIFKSDADVKQLETTTILEAKKAALQAELATL